ncbi:unnamed protein product [Agarophyton chilense]
MDHKRTRKLAAACAKCCANRHLPKCAHCRMYMCKLVCKSAATRRASHHSASQQAAPASKPSSQPSPRSGPQSASPPDSTPPKAVQPAAQPTTTSVKSAHSPKSAPKPASNNNSVPSPAPQPNPATPSDTQQLDQTMPNIEAEQDDGFTPLCYPLVECASNSSFSTVVDGLDVAYFHHRKHFRSVNVVRALKFLHKKDKKPVAFIPYTYVDFRCKNPTLADDPCVLKTIEAHGLVHFAKDSKHYAWHMLTFAKQRGCQIVSNRRYEVKRKVRIPPDVQVSPEELNELFEYVEHNRVPYKFRGQFATKE